MTLSKMLKASLFGVLSFSSSALAKRELSQNFPTHLPNGDPFPSFGAPSGGSPSPAPTGAVTGATTGATSSHTPTGGAQCSESSATCTSVSIGYSNVTNMEALAEAAVSTAAYMCSPEGVAEAEAIASATASAFAIAVADASVSCSLEGCATGTGNASADATARAEVWLTAYAQAATTATVCGQCDAYAYAWGYVQDNVFLEAIASAEAKLNLISNGGNIAGTVISFMQDVEGAVVTAYAEALAGAKAVKDKHECAAWGSAEGCIYSEDDPQGLCASCKVHAVSLSDVIKIDAIATASTGAAAFTCGDHAVAYADVEVTAKAIAEATAIAVSFMHAECEADEGGYACADAGTHIETSAMAVAEAYANAWAVAIDCDECVANVDAAVSSIATILVKAATEAYGTLCASDGEHWTVHDFQLHIETGYLEALAEAAAVAFSSSDAGICVAAVTLDTYAGPLVPH